MLKSGLNEDCKLAMSLNYLTNSVSWTFYKYNPPLTYRYCLQKNNPTNTYLCCFCDRIVFYFLFISFLNAYNFWLFLKQQKIILYEIVYHLGMSESRLYVGFDSFIQSSVNVGSKCVCMYDCGCISVKCFLLHCFYVSVGGKFNDCCLTMPSLYAFIYFLFDNNISCVFVFLWHIRICILRLFLLINYSICKEWCM